MSRVVVSSILILRTNGHTNVLFIFTPGVLRGWVYVMCVYYILVIPMLISYEHNLSDCFIYISICPNILWTQFSWLFHLYIEVVYYVVIDRFNTLWTQSAVLFHLLSNCILHFINTIICIFMLHIVNVPFYIKGILYILTDVYIGGWVYTCSPDSQWLICPTWATVLSWD